MREPSISKMMGSKPTVIEGGVHRKNLTSYSDKKEGQSRDTMKKIDSLLEYSFVD